MKTKGIFFLIWHTIFSEKMHFLKSQSIRLWPLLMQKVFCILMRCFLFCRIYCMTKNAHQILQWEKIMKKQLWLCSLGIIWCHSCLGLLQCRHWITLYNHKGLKGKHAILNVIFVCFAHSNLYSLIYDIDCIIARSCMY